MNFIQNTIFSLLGVSAIAVQASTISIGDQSFAGPINFDNLSIIDQQDHTVDGIASTSLMVGGGPGLRLLFGGEYEFGGGEITMNIEHNRGMLIRSSENLDLSSKFGNLLLSSGNDIVLETYKSEPNNPNATLGGVFINADTNVTGALTVNGETVLTRNGGSPVFIQRGITLGHAEHGNEATQEHFFPPGIAGGLGNKASGSSLVFGLANTFEGRSGILIGQSNKANGTGSFVAGAQNEVILSAQDMGGNSHALGTFNKIYSSLSFAFGQSNTISNLANSSHAIGFYNNINQPGNFAIGGSNNMNSKSSLVLGYANESNSFNSIVVGNFNKPNIDANPNERVENDHLFVVANGKSETERSNAFVVLRNGDIIIPKVQGDVAMGIFGD